MLVHMLAKQPKHARILSHRLEHRVTITSTNHLSWLLSKRAELSFSHETFLICEQWTGEVMLERSLSCTSSLCAYLQAWSEDGGRPRDHIRWAASHQGLSSPLQHCKSTFLLFIKASAWRWPSRPARNYPAYQDTSVPNTAACLCGNSITPGKRRS